MGQEKVWIHCNDYVDEELIDLNRIEEVMDDIEDGAHHAPRL